MWKSADLCLTNEQILEVLIQLPIGNILLLDGPTGCGKTSLLKKMATSEMRTIKIYSIEDFREFLVERIRRSPYRLTELPGNDIIAIEDVDFLGCTDSIQIEAAFLIERSLKKHPIILTGIQLYNRLPDMIQYFLRSKNYIRLCEYIKE